MFKTPFVSVHFRERAIRELAEDIEAIEDQSIQAKAKLEAMQTEFEKMLNKKGKIRKQYQDEAKVLAMSIANARKQRMELYQQCMTMKDVKIKMENANTFKNLVEAIYDVGLAINGKVDDKYMKDLDNAFDQFEKAEADADDMTERFKEFNERRLGGADLDNRDELLEMAGIGGDDSDGGQGGYETDEEEDDRVRLLPSVEKHEPSPKTPYMPEQTDIPHGFS